uniref:survival motor neuron protein-like n=1 Tax=Bombus vancouverensis nearcticus TaxID=2705178 RepID=UPI00143ABB28
MWLKKIFLECKLEILKYMLCVDNTSAVKLIKNPEFHQRSYGNTEKVELSSLLESEGLQSQIAQQKKALEEKFNEENDETSNAYKHHFIPGPSFNSMTDIMPPAPPLPPQLMAKLPDNDTDALSSMLMSWYISGYMVYYT